MKNKKGLSSVIATVLLVLLTLAAAAIVIAVVVPFVRDNLSESTRCASYTKYFTFEENSEFNCIKDETQALISVRAESVERGANGSRIRQLNDSVTGFSLGFENESASIGITIPSPETRMLNFSQMVKIPLPGEVKTYNLTLNKGFKRVEIHPRVNGKICPTTDEIELKIC